MDGSSKDGFPEDSAVGGRLHYRLCPHCLRAVPAGLNERYCVNDGTRLLEGCPVCQRSISSPYAHFCAACGHPFALPAREEPR
ncbi:zinc ribbon domain-containing protein [Deinococcus oregonensis]|uniref:Zinc ribbon domain-containing protein n=1 Tax=Deinococcus oregonensis TaxID=1805970 RepID=A0ABV6B682_9DEIO